MQEIFQFKDARRKQSVERSEQELRQALPWLWVPGFRIGANEGFDGRVFGARAGYRDDTSVYSLLHEVGHAVEMTLLPSRIWKRRVCRPNFEMRVRGRATVCGVPHEEAKTMQATERECRVGGMQMTLLASGGYATQDFVSRFCESLHHMADWYMGGSLPQRGKDTSQLSQEERQWLSAREQLIGAARERFTLADIQDRWATVMAWMYKKS